jgi:phenylalanyl-tRNA synthetase alpha chain
VSSPSHPTEEPVTAVHLTADQLRRDLSIRDLTDPGEGPHAIQRLVDRAVEALAAAWDCEVQWCRGPRLVPVTDNYDGLGFAPDSVTRDARYTRYVDDDRMLRSHSSAMVPPALRRLRAGTADDVLLVCPGVVFRRDAIDWQHTGTPHQLDLWRITRRPLGDGDMDEMISLLLGALTAGRTPRQVRRVHPYTRHGRQVDVSAGDRWVEVWECGLAHPDVLGRAGLEGRSGLALGLGLDRLLMLAKGVPDIRLLRSTDARIASQMLDLDPYRPVSAMPPLRRDLSIAVDADEDEETLGDKVRDARSVEQVEILSTTPCDDLPPAARRRLGSVPGQKNLLVRVVLRDLETTLTDDEGNRLRDRIYGALHRGTEFQWSTAASVPDAARRASDA